MSTLSKAEQLIKKGVHIPNPQSVEIDDDVDLERISADSVSIYSGCKLHGKETLILRGAKLGYEAPVTINNCYIGPQVELKGGFFKNATFLKGAGMGSGAHVREGTILEEAASCAHTVGLKQTLLFPFVTLGSLINFCDCFMAGGTNSKNHSEVGSSYIHFNYTPNQDKATASLIGNVPQGVMLNQPPIFLGGQGGLVGPVRLAFGTIIAAGSIYRKDELRSGLLLFDGGTKSGKMAFTPGLYRNIKRSVYNNLIYIGNLFALRQWYRWVRYEFISEDFPETLLKGLRQTLETAISERISRLKSLSSKMNRSMELYVQTFGDKVSDKLMAQKKELSSQWPKIEASFETLKEFQGDTKARDVFLNSMVQLIPQNQHNYIQTIQGIDNSIKSLGTQWLNTIIDTTLKEIFNFLPSYGISL
jgi:UDP-N-acetylglucosamine/UDP-N-acetylgalactosamine diphosphorylase